MPYGAGDLRSRVTIQRQVNSKNPETGGLTRGWETVATVWAEVLSLNGREAMVGNVLQGISQYRISIRYRSDIKVSDRILWNGHELNIHSADPVGGRRVWLAMIASTASPQGD